MEAFRLKRKLLSKEEPELAKRQRLVKHLKAKDGVFAALRSTLSQAVLPNKKAASAVHIISRSSDQNKSADEGNQEEKGPVSCSDSSSSDEENHAPDKEAAASRSCSDSLQENRQMSGGDDCPLIPLPPKSSPEMAVNGS